MGFAPRSRRTVAEPRVLTVVPFNRAGRGVGDVPPTVMIETPDDETALLVCVEPQGAGRAEADRCMVALNAFRAGYAESDGRAITVALVAGVAAANHALFASRAARGRALAVGLTALAVRGADAYVIQAGPGQALIAGGDTLVALPPLVTGAARGSVHAGAGSVPALGLEPYLEPDLFHVDASGGLCATLCHSHFARLLARDDAAPLRSSDAQAAADYLVLLAARHHLAEGYGVVVSAGMPDDAPRAIPAPRGALRDAAPRPAPRPGRPSPPSPQWLPPPRRDRVPDGFPEATNHHDEEESNEDAGDVPSFPPRASRRAPSRTSLPPASFDERDNHFPNGDDAPATWDARTDDEDRTPIPRRPAPRLPARRVAGIPTRLMLLLVAVLCTFVVFIGAVSVRAWNDRQADAAVDRELDAIVADRARAQALAGRDPQAAYSDLEPLLPRLDAAAQTGRQAGRVQGERVALIRAFDSLGNVTRVVPKVVGPLDHLEGKTGSNRLLLLGDDGQLYLLDRNERGDWAVFTYDVIAGKRGSSLFATGQAALRGSAGELRGLVWSGGPATSDRTRLFVRTANGAWAELPLVGLNDRRPTAVTMANDVLYLLDASAGQIVRLSLRDNTPAKVWTNEATVPDLRSGVDLVADGQTVWVLLADGRVRGFTGGATAMPAKLVAATVLPPLRGVTAITSNANSKYLYVMEATGGRILRINKENGRLVQAFRSTGENVPGLDNVQSMAVDEARGVFYCVTADGVLSFPLPPAPP